MPMASFLAINLYHSSQVLNQLHKTLCYPLLYTQKRIINPPVSFTQKWMIDPPVSSNMIISSISCCWVKTHQSDSFAKFHIAITIPPLSLSHMLFHFLSIFFMNSNLPSTVIPTMNPASHYTQGSCMDGSMISVCK
jgi:hypothetical protein